MSSTASPSPASPPPPAQRRSLTIGGLESVVGGIAPPDLADSWDNVGLQLGDPRAEVRRALVALEATSAVVEEAKAKSAEVLITHHPLIFHAPKRILANDPIGGLILQLARAGIALIAAHTNLDRSPVGTNFVLASHIPFRKTELLQPSKRDTKLKFVVFVPVGHERKIIDAVGKAGAGVIGAYTHCTFRSPGTGTYVPQAGAKPFAGEVGALEQAEEVRLECVVDKAKLGSLLQEVRTAHPYEEMAYDVYPLVEQGATYGLGLVGPLDSAMTLEDLALRLRERLGLRAVQVIGDPARKVSRVAVSSGSGTGVSRGVSPSKADVLVTGECDHHAAMEAREKGLSIICVGHHESEVIVVPQFAKLLREAPAVAAAGVEIIESTAEVPPIRTLA